MLEKIGKVMRMNNVRLSKALVMGWYEGLEGKDEKTEEKRKTFLYWKIMLSECSVDWNVVERVCR